ncbi:hypothetical protein KBT16_02200 [Nostoc sp. CCCryo 231-06]|nr:hypothetical protein [Nostoc sp. CCCryo 231-06]
MTLEVKGKAVGRGLWEGRGAITSTEFCNLNSAGKFYQQLLSQLGETVGVADGEPYTECISGQVAKLLVACLLWV